MTLIGWKRGVNFFSAGSPLITFVWSDCDQISHDNTSLGEAYEVVNAFTSPCAETVRPERRNLVIIYGNVGGVE